MTQALPPRQPRVADELPDRRDRWLFLISGGILLVALLAAIGREQRWGESRFTVDLVAPRADGLQEGMEVRLSGMPIGRVESLRLQNDARVAVRLQINDRYRHLIGPRSRAQSDRAGLVGLSYVSLTPDPRPSNQASASLPPLPYDPPPDLNQLVADLTNSRKQLDRTLSLTAHLMNHQVPNSLGSLQNATGKLSGSMADLSSMSKTLESETRRTVPGVRDLTSTLQREGVKLGPAVRGTLASANRTLNRADQTADTAAQASREAQLLLQQTRPVLIPTLQNLQEITGAAARLVRFVSGLGLLEPGTATPRSAPPRTKADLLDPHKVHPTSPDPSPYPP